MNALNKSEIMQTIPQLPNCSSIKNLLAQNIKNQKVKIFVLDDDPTGIQTVHGVTVFTRWDENVIRSAFFDQAQLFYILTNTRGLKANQAQQINQVIAENICKISNETGIDFTIISRSDSTLRGHYPLETDTLRQVIEKNTNKVIHGEIIIPFFKEGGRFTYNDIHWVEQDGWLIPADQTEFAKDNTFGFSNSDLKKWIEEKTLAKVKSENVLSISLETIRNKGYKEIKNILLQTQDFQKIIINAFDYEDLIIFTMGLVLAEQEGKNFLFRTAASFVKIRGAISDKSLLTRDQLVKNNNNGGLIIIGSHVAKTTQQFNKALELPFIKTYELNVPNIISGHLEEEVFKISTAINNNIAEGKTVLIYTSRAVITAKIENSEANLDISLKVSEAIVKIVKALTITPGFIIAKGGITSSDVGTKGLAVKSARVAGQIKPGIPVWITGQESKFPGLPYIIFPGNVGSTLTLKEMIEELQA